MTDISTVAASVPFFTFTFAILRMDGNILPRFFAALYTLALRTHLRVPFHPLMKNPAAASPASSFVFIQTQGGPFQPR